MRHARVLEIRQGMMRIASPETNQETGEMAAVLSRLLPELPPYQVQGPTDGLHWRAASAEDSLSIIETRQAR